MFDLEFFIGNGFIFFFSVHRNCEMSKSTEYIIKGLLQLNPGKRLTATQVREQLKAIIDSHNGVGNDDHLVPELDMDVVDNSHYSTSPPATPFNEKTKTV